VNLLLDTCVVLWWLDGAEQLSPDTRAAIVSAPDVLVSAATIWEIEINRAIGKLEVPDDVVDVVLDAGFRLLSIDAVHAVAAAGLPRHHDDLFDRMLVAQARQEQLTLVTADSRIPLYDCTTMAAR
jgi:PIN domain nuclease of toxin-antitoxin system